MPAGAAHWHASVAPAADAAVTAVGPTWGELDGCQGVGQVVGVHAGRGGRCAADRPVARVAAGERGGSGCDLRSQCTNA